MRPKTGKNFKFFIRLDQKGKNLKFWLKFTEKRRKYESFIKFVQKTAINDEKFKNLAKFGQKSIGIHTMVNSLVMLSLEK